VNVGAARAAELLKLLRSQRLSITQITAATGWSEKAATRWAKDWLEMGILVREVAEHDGRKGTLPMLYTLSKEWGGE
jgi:DNA-binding transcriptional ArsR family regulator